MDPCGAVLRSALARPDIRRVELAYAGFNVAEYGVWIAVLVYAYERGGTGAAALLAVAQLLPAAMLAPILARRIDRHGPVAALWQGYLAQAVALCSTAGLLLAGAPPGAVWPAAICAAVAVTATRPAQATLVPLLTSSRAELTAVNVLSSWVESASVLAGAALAGGLIALGGPGTAVLAFALASVLATAATAPLARLALRADLVPGGTAADTRPTLDPAHARAGLAPLLGLLAAQYLLVGLLDVAIVALAIGVLGLGASGAGYLNAAVGAGGLLGSLLAVTLIAPRRLTPALVGASVGWGIALALLGIWPTPLGAFALLAGAGCGRSLLDVSGRTLLMRHSLASDRARLFGALEGASMLALAGGSALVPLLAIVGGLRGALIVVGGLLILGVLLAARNLQRLEERDQQPMPTRWAAPLTTAGSITNQYGNAYAGYQAGIQDGGNCDTIIYGQVATGLPDALIEDPAWTPATVLVAHRDRVTWDAPIRSLADAAAVRPAHAERQALPARQRPRVSSRSMST